MREDFAELKRMVEEAEKDLDKAAAGSGQAGIRFRRVMMDIRNQSQVLRKAALEKRHEKRGG